MKMNLSVVMQTIDKMSAPLKKITSTQSQYSKQIAEIRAQSEKLSSNQALIAQYQKTEKEAGKTSVKFNEAKQKLALLSDKMKSAKKPSEALQKQMKRQQEIVKGLKTTQSAYTHALSKTQDKMKTAGINVNRLSHEEKRLTKEYDHRIATIAKLATKEARLQRVRAKLSKFKMPNIGGAAVGKVGALLGGASFAGLFTMVNSAAGEMDKLSKTAQNLKMPVKELQAMQSQAEHAGLSSDRMGTSLLRFTKRLGVLQTTGTGALGSFLKKGKSPLYGELKKAKTTQEAYGKLLETFGKLKTNQEKMALADATFGNDGRRMLIMLEEGTQGLSSARNALNAHGGIITTEDTQKAQKYKDALQNVQESVRAIKFAALTPIMAKLTASFTAFSEKFKNAKWRTAVIEKIKEVVISLFNAFKVLGKGILFLGQHMPEVIAGLASFKIAMFALNAAMLGNPIGLTVAAIAAMSVGIAYLMNKAGVLMPTLTLLWTCFKRFGAGIGSIVSGLVQKFLMIPRAIMKMVSLIPNSLLPDGWGEGIKSAQQNLESFNKSVGQFGDKSNHYAATGEFTETHNKLETVRQQVNAPKHQAMKQVMNALFEPGETGGNNVRQDATAQPSKQVTEFKKTHERLEIVRQQINAPQHQAIKQAMNAFSEPGDTGGNNVRQDATAQPSKQVFEFKKTHERLKIVREQIKDAQQDKQPNQKTPTSENTPSVKNQAKGDSNMLRHPTVQSKSQLDVRIKSDKPVEIVKVASDKQTEMNVETFDLLGWSF